MLLQLFCKAQIVDSKTCKQTVMTRGQKVSLSYFLFSERQDLSLKFKKMSRKRAVKKQLASPLDSTTVFPGFERSTVVK